MNNVARSILSTGCFVFFIMGAMDWIGWGNSPDWIGHFSSGWALASLIAFIGAPPKRTKVTVTKPVSGVTAKNSTER